MRINHNCSIKLVRLVIFIYDARSHIHQISCLILYNIRTWTPIVSWFAYILYAFKCAFFRKDVNIFLKCKSL